MSKLINSFFHQYITQIQKKIQEYTEQSGTKPGMSEFIDIIVNFVINDLRGKPGCDQYIENFTKAALELAALKLEKHYNKCLEKIVSPKTSTSQAAAPPVVRGDGAILADGSVASKTALVSRLGMRPQDAVHCVNSCGISRSCLRGTGGIYYHNTIKADGSGFGVRDDDGKYKITCIFEPVDGVCYLVAIARHWEEESAGKGKSPVPTYKVQYALCSKTYEGEILRFC